MVKKFSVLSLSLSLVCAADAWGASKPVYMQSPAVDGAYVLELPGMVNGEKHTTISGAQKTIHDGLVLRKTRIKSDGTIVIPPAGIYTTARCGNWRPFDNEKIYVGPTPFYYINQRDFRTVLQNVEFQLGEVKPMNPNKTRGWELSSISTDGYFMPNAMSATFKMVKSTGNYYGSTFNVIMGPAVVNDGANGKAASAKNYQKAGFYTMTDSDFTDMNLIGNNVAAGGRTYVIVDEITPTSVKVREMGTDGVVDAWISPSEPLIASYAKGDKFTIGNASVEVTNVAADSVSIRLNEGGKTVEKTFGPYNDATKAKLFLSEKTRELFWLLSPSGKEVVFLNVNELAGPIAGGKASLVAYKDVINVQDGTEWPLDPRFMARPESCTSCSFIHEIMLENKDEIELGKADKTFVGPQGYYKVVIDDFDGKTIKAWHLEDKAGNKTANLAGRSQGQHIDAVVGDKCRSTSHFFGRVNSALLREAIAANANK